VLAGLGLILTCSGAAEAASSGDGAAPFAVFQQKKRSGFHLMQDPKVQLELKRILGRDYGEFMGSMYHIVTEGGDQEVPPPPMLAAIGWVRGIGNAGYLLAAPSRKLWGLYCSRFDFPPTWTYFTNVDRDRKKPPPLVQEWLENEAPEAKVLVHRKTSRETISRSPCDPADRLVHGTTPQRVRLPNQGKLYFQQEPKPCPAKGPCPWRRRGYLVDGNLVQAIEALDGLTCVFYRSRDCHESTGWVVSKNLEPAPPEATPLSARDWSGSWIRDEFDSAFIRIEEVSDGTLKIRGEAYAGAHVGNFSGLYRAEGAKLVNITPLSGESDECRVELAWKHGRIDVRGNWHCGGFEVTFKGGYVRDCDRKLTLLDEKSP
jgi:hypothetical protein